MTTPSDFIRVLCNLISHETVTGIHSSYLPEPDRFVITVRNTNTQTVVMHLELTNEFIGEIILAPDYEDRPEVVPWDAVNEIRKALRPYLKRNVLLEIY